MYLAPAFHAASSIFHTGIKGIYTNGLPIHCQITVRDKVVLLFWTLIIYDRLHLKLHLPSGATMAEIDRTALLGILLSLMLYTRSKRKGSGGRKPKLFKSLVGCFAPAMKYFFSRI